MLSLETRHLLFFIRLLAWKTRGCYQGFLPLAGSFYDPGVEWKALNSAVHLTFSRASDVVRLGESLVKSVVCMSRHSSPRDLMVGRWWYKDGR